MNALNKILIVLILSVLISCGHQEQANDAPPAITTTVQEFTGRNRPELLNYSGGIKPGNGVSPAFALAGMITRVNDLGSPPMEGQLLATVETDDDASALQEGFDGDDIAALADIDEGKGIVEDRREDKNKIFEKVEIEPSFKGGESAWYRYLEANLDPGVPFDNGAPAGSYKVYVKFVVSKDGTISDVRPLTSYGYGMEAEAVRVIQKSPTWIAAIQNGRTVNAYCRQPIIFRVPAE